MRTASGETEAIDEKGRTLVVSNELKKDSEQPLQELLLVLKAIQREARLCNRAGLIELSERALALAEDCAQKKDG